MGWASCFLQTPMMMGQLLAERYVFPLEPRRIIGLRSSLHTSLISKHGRRITQNQNQLQKKNLVQLATGQQTMEDFFRKREVFKFDNPRQIISPTFFRLLAKTLKRSATCCKNAGLASLSSELIRFILS